MSLPYRILHGTYARDLIMAAKTGSPSHADFYDVDFEIQDAAYEGRLFTVQYGRYPDGSRMAVGFYERQVKVDGSLYDFSPFPQGLNIDLAALEQIVREQGEAAFEQEPPFDERERQRKARNTAKN